MLKGNVRENVHIVRSLHQISLNSNKIQELLITKIIINAAKLCRTVCDYETLSADFLFKKNRRSEEENWKVKAIVY